MFLQNDMGWQKLAISPLHDLVTWYGINYADLLTQITQRDIQNRATLTSPARLSFCLFPYFGLVEHQIVFKVTATALRQTVIFQDFLQTRLKVSLPSIVISRTKARHPLTPPRPLLRTQRLYLKGLL